MFFGGIYWNKNNPILATNNIIKSILYSILNVIGFIKVATPIINVILNILEPIMFPTEISLLPFKAATTLVTSSGRLVPIAIIVKLIIFSLILKNSAIITELSTIKFPPNFNATIPIKI